MPLPAALRTKPNTSGLLPAVISAAFTAREIDAGVVPPMGVGVAEAVALADAEADAVAVALGVAVAVAEADTSSRPAPGVAVADVSAKRATEPAVMASAAGTANQDLRMKSPESVLRLLPPLG